ncbi:MAG: translation initiation factor IF-3 [bacterium]
MFIVTNNEPRINEEIRAQEVRVIDENGAQKGIMTIQDALAYAQQVELDLVEMVPDGQPPVCKVIDYSKFKYQQEKKNRQSRKAHKNLELKEIKIRPKIGAHDLEVKMNHIKEFIEEGHRVRVSIIFRGREMAHIELGAQILDKIKEEFKEISTVEGRTKLEGNDMGMLLVPKKVQ